MQSFLLLRVFWTGQRVPYGSVRIFLVWITHSLHAKLLCNPLWPHETLALAPHLLDITYSRMAFCTQECLGKNLHILKVLFFPQCMLSLADLIQCLWTIIIMKTTPKYKCLALASFQLLYTCWVAS